MVVGALAVVNSAGQVIEPATGLPRFHEGIRLRRPPAEQRQALIEPLRIPPTPLNTTIGVIATTAALTKPECRKMAAVAHDGLAALFARFTHCSTATRSSACRQRSIRSPPMNSQDSVAPTPAPAWSTRCLLLPPIALPSPAHVL